MTAVLELEVRHKRYSEATVLQGLRLTLRAGEVVSLVGASGCGKSTLLRIAAGLEQQFDGSVQLDGQPLTALTPSIGFIFQEPRLFPWLNVADNVAFSAGARPGAGVGDARALALLAEVGLAGLERQWPKQLSGGQAQRAAIARGLYTQPRVLLLDEPFSAVDAFTRIKLQDLIAGLAQRHGITLLLVTHDVDEAVQLSDRVLVMQARPGRFGEEIPIDLPRPRDRGDAALAAAKAEVLRALYAVHAL